MCQARKPDLHRHKLFCLPWQRGPCHSHPSMSLPEGITPLGCPPTTRLAYCLPTLVCFPRFATRIPSMQPQRSLSFVAVVFVGLLMPGFVSAGELAVISEKTWDEFVPKGKEV